MILVNGVAENRINITDRGLQYGDGLFETIAVRKGIAEFLDAHLNRLVLGCEKLSIPFQQMKQLQDELNTVFHSLNNTDAVIKIIITRGSGGRGYLANSDGVPTRIISTHLSPEYSASDRKTGIRVRFCQHKLSENTALAGIKHLNRLDQVLARNEWHDTDITEGLMFDQDNNVVEGTMSNLFMVSANQLLTPILNKSGVAGIMRGQIIRLASENELAVKQCLISTQQLIDADEVFICNSVMGIMPVANIIDTDTTYAVGPITQRLQQALQQTSK